MGNQNYILHLREERPLKQLECSNKRRALFIYTLPNKAHTLVFKSELYRRGKARNFFWLSTEYCPKNGTVYFLQEIE